MLTRLRRLPHRVFGYLRRRRLHDRIDATRALLSGYDAWYALDQLGIAGFGTDLVRVDFPPEIGKAAALTRSLGPNPRLAEVFARAMPAARQRLAELMAHAPAAADWPDNPDPARPHLPYWKNPFLSRPDMLALFGIVTAYRPARYIEIGSGVSTRIAHAAKTAARLPMEIVSIDPAPRLEVEALCHRAIRGRLEDQVEHVVSLVRNGDVLFFDGSHRVFPGSDVTRFVLEVLPRLPAGVLVHMHDIHLPADYPDHLWDRLWSEQYLLAAWLLGGARGIEILLPCAELARDHDAARIITATTGESRADEVATCSFWLTTNGA